MQLFFQCSPYHKDNALHLFIVQLKNAGLEAKDSIERRLEKMGITAFNQNGASVAIVELSENRWLSAAIAPGAVGPPR